MARRMPRRRNDDNAFHRLFAILDESQAVLVGQQVLCALTSATRTFIIPVEDVFRFISPKIVLDLGHDDLRVGEQALAFIAQNSRLG